MDLKNRLFETHDRALRHPGEIFGSPFEIAGISPETLLYEMDEGFKKLLNRFSLLIGREYENLLTIVSKEKQTFFHLPHPSGAVYDPKRQALFIAATRNPNQIIEFKPSKDNILLPARAKFYPGKFYFHDLALIDGALFANSVGQNGILRVSMEEATPESLCWWPKCVEKEGGADTTANFIQLNSIAAGSSIENSYFSATADEITPLRPGNPLYPVDRRGVLFSGKTREPIVRGLTRPHSARLYRETLWLNNSGYGQFGQIAGSQFIPLASLSGWTRGLTFYDNIAFVGLSRILPKFKAYAPGITSSTESCAVVALEIPSGKFLGRVDFPYGNQIFAIEILPEELRFPYEQIRDTYDQENAMFYAPCFKK
jgi:uncharacterized protein (TIGR03032 family)